MVHLFGGISFGTLNLLKAKETRFLLRACAKTLRTLQLHPNDRRGELLLIVFEILRRFQANNLIVRSSLLDFDLSGHKSLQALEMQVDSVDKALWNGSLDRVSRFYKYVLSTIRSPGFSQVHVLYEVCDFQAVDSGRLYPVPPLRRLSRDKEAEEASQHLNRFELLRRMHKVRDFQLELFAFVWESRRDYVMRLMKEAVAAEKARGGFDVFFPEPLVTFYPRSFL
jgi:hypothetical protein